MQDFASEEDVQAWVRSQPHGMGRLKLGLMVGEGRLSERGMAAARRWLAGGAAAPGRIEPVLAPEAAVPPAPPLPVPPVPPPVEPATAAADQAPPPPLFPIRPPPAAIAPEPADAAPAAAAAEPAAARPARRRHFNWFEAVAILVLLGVAYYLLTELARVAGRT